MEMPAPTMQEWIVFVVREEKCDPSTFQSLNSQEMSFMLKKAVLNSTRIMTNPLLVAISKTEHYATNVPHPKECFLLHTN